jgi:hypothetical protein
MSQHSPAFSGFENWSRARLERLVELVSTLKMSNMGKLSDVQLASLLTNPVRLVKDRKGRRQLEHTGEFIDFGIVEFGNDTSFSGKVLIARKANAQIIQNRLAALKKVSKKK